MIFKVRYNTFETNSSSAHTCILKPSSPEATDDEINEYIEYILERYGDQEWAKSKDDFCIPIFGDTCYSHGFEILDSWKDRLSYIIADSNGNFKRLELISEVVEERIPGCSGFIFLADTGVFNSIAFNLDFDGIERNFPIISDESSFFLGGLLGSIDHQSIDNSSRCLEALKELPEYSGLDEKELIRIFIFSNKIDVIVDSDSNEELPRLIRNGFIDADKVGAILIEKFKTTKTNKEVTTISYGKFVPVDQYEETLYEDD